MTGLFTARVRRRGREFDQPRCDPAPLLAYARDLYVRRYDWPIQGPGQLAGVLGVDRSAIYRWIRDGITWHRAVKVCDALDVDCDRLWPGFTRFIDDWYESRRLHDNAKAAAYRARTSQNQRKAA